MAFDHNELGQHLASTSHYVIYQILWFLATPNCGVLRPQIFSLLTIKCRPVGLPCLTILSRFVTLDLTYANWMSSHAVCFFMARDYNIWREPICVRSLSQFVVAKAPNLWKVTKPEENGHSTHTSHDRNIKSSNDIIFFIGKYNNKYTSLLAEPYKDLLWPEDAHNLPSFTATFTWNIWQ